MPPRPYRVKFNKQVSTMEQLRERVCVSQQHLSAEVNDHIVAYAGPYCGALCIGIQQHLPRELRDMIYVYLLPVCDVLIEATDFLPLGSTDSSRPRLIDAPHLLSPKFSDVVTRRELFEAWYKFSTFQFANIALIPIFLNKDLWDLDLPVRRLVRSLEIDIWPTDRMADTDFARVLDQRALLDWLIALRKSARIVFPIDTNTYTPIWCRDSKKIQRFITILSRFFSPVKRLLAAGHHVVVEVDGSLVVEIKLEDLTTVAWDQKIKEKLMVI
jgi:hypothetical protein